MFTPSHAFRYQIIFFQNYSKLEESILFSHNFENPNKKKLKVKKEKEPLRRLINLHTQIHTIAKQWVP